MGERSRISLSGLLLLSVIAAVFGDDTDAVMPQVRHPRPQPGFVTVSGCSDSRCRNCHAIETNAVHFGMCMPVPDCPGISQMYHCLDWSTAVLIQNWRNPHC